MVMIRVEWGAGADRALGLPQYASAGRRGPTCARISRIAGRLRLAPGTRALIPTGLRLAIPAGYEVQIRPRSGLALTHGITLPNSPGTIDSDYRGPLGVILQNGGDANFTVTHGSRIAQMVVAPVVQAAFEVGPLDETDRGAGGFGSTGAA